MDNPHEIRPSPVHDIATIIVSELTFLHSRLGDAEPAFRHEPGFKLPAHVYRKAQILKLRLQELEARVRTNPNLQKVGVEA